MSRRNNDDFEIDNVNYKRFTCEIVNDFKIDDKVIRNPTRKHEFLNTDDLLNLCAKKDFHYHEVTQGECKLYFDIDRPIEEEDYEDVHEPALIEAWDALERVLKKNPRWGNYLITGQDASGMKSDNTWKISIHLVVNNIGCRRSGADWMDVVKDYENELSQTEHFDNHLDTGCYKKFGMQQSLRLLFASKINDPKRKLRPFAVKRFGIDNQTCISKYTIKDFEDKKQKIEDYLITACSDELFDDHAEYEEELSMDRAPDEILSPEATQRSFENMSKIISAFNPIRAESEPNWKQGLWAIHRCAARIGAMEMFRPLAHQFSKLSAKYKSDETDGEYDRNPGSQGYGWVHLMEMATEDSPNWNERNPDRKIVKSYYDDKRALCRRPNLTRFEVEDWMMGCLAVMENTERWFVRMRKGWEVLPGGAATTFPFKNITAEADLDIAGPKILGPDKKTLIEGPTVKLPYWSILKGIQNSEMFEKNCVYSTEKFVPYFKEKPEGIFNSFPGWMYDFHDIKIADDDLDLVPVFELMYDLCGREKMSLNYFLDWMGAYVQKPQEKMPVILFYSFQQGAGKGVLEEFLYEHVFGTRQCMGLTDMSVLLGHFNSAITDTQLFFCQELQEKGKSISNTQAWKELVTGKRIATVKKLKEADKYARNYGKFLISTNNKYCLVLEISDRRAALFECNCSRVGDFEYFKQLTSKIHNAKVGAKFLNWLSQRDILKFVPSEIPETQLRQDVKARSMHSSLRHIKAVCEGTRAWKPKLNTITIPTKELYQDYVSYCNAEGLRATFKKDSYDEQLKMNLKMEDKQHTFNKVKQPRGWKIDFETLDRQFMCLLKRDTSCFDVDLDEEDEIQFEAEVDEEEALMQRLQEVRRKKALLAK